MIVPGASLELGSMYRHQHEPPDLHAMISMGSLHTA